MTPLKHMIEQPGSQTRHLETADVSAWLGASRDPWG
jgi:hypothetical protein